MGSTFRRNEQPVRWVYQSAYSLGRHPVTVGIWREYCQANSMKMPVSYTVVEDFKPIVNVSWKEVIQFCDWVSSFVGFQVFLPTEAQWERGCRGGNHSKLYPWGDGFIVDNLWFSAETLTTGPVNRRDNIYVNDFGLADMVGNVYELCFDAYEEEHQCRIPKVRIAVNPVNKAKSKDDLRSVRGVDWKARDPLEFRCASRTCQGEESRSHSTGFRLSSRPRYFHGNPS